MNHVYSELKTLYKQFLTADLSTMVNIYHAHCVFSDPVKSVTGVANLQTYFRHSRQNLTHCQFEFVEEIVNSDAAFLSWEMRYAHPKLYSGRPLCLPGASHLKFKDNLVMYHRDYYDLGKMLYEHVPVLGSGVRWLKKRI